MPQGLGLFLLLFQAGQQTAEPDFHLVMQKCSTTVGYLALSDEGLKTVEGTPTTNACTRRGKSVSCRIAFADQSQGMKGSTAQYTIILDSPPLLLFADEHSGDFFAVDTTQHAAVVITRVLDKQFAGTKVCHGLFATQSEMEALRKK
jgi:hypothetical protein